MEAINATREAVWKEQASGFPLASFMIPMARSLRLWEECKGGHGAFLQGSGVMRLDYSLARHREVLYLVNRPGNVVSHEAVCPGSIGP